MKTWFLMVHILQLSKIRIKFTLNLAAVTIRFKHIAFVAVADKGAFSVLAKMTADIEVVHTLIYVNTVRAILLKLKSRPAPAFLQKGCT